MWLVTSQANRAGWSEEVSAQKQSTRGGRDWLLLAFDWKWARGYICIGVAMMVQIRKLQVADCRWRMQDRFEAGHEEIQQYGIED